ncbi:hypothetical protein CRG98_022570 [Punica granatum]|uniref:Uncharacterized protein n=1 Tax=Punica granatum TaxID=22663 RepID=A0A2I0JNG0_PUNGR|nr:hypothetical protein CRG98_022570 [Punica granatum]
MNTTKLMGRSRRINIMEPQENARPQLWDNRDLILANEGPSAGLIVTANMLQQRLSSTGISTDKNYSLSPTREYDYKEIVAIVESRKKKLGKERSAIVYCPHLDKIGLFSFNMFFGCEGKPHSWAANSGRKAENTFFGGRWKSGPNTFLPRPQTLGFGFRVVTQHLTADFDL